MTLKCWARICLAVREGFPVSVIARRFSMTPKQVINFKRKWGMRPKLSERVQVQLRLFK